MTSAEVAVASGCRHGFPAGTCPLCGEQGEEQQLRRGGEEKAACYPDEEARRAAWAAGWEQLPCEAATGPAPSAEEVEEAFISALDGALSSRHRVPATVPRPCAPCLNSTPRRPKLPKP